MLGDSTSKLEQPIVYLESKNCVQSIDPSGQYLFSGNFSGSLVREKWVYLCSVEQDIF